jgi:uncharacterized protein (DUF362 family)
MTRRTLLTLPAIAAASRATTPPAAPVPVAVAHGEDRAKNVYNALVAVDDQIRPLLKRKKYVLLKPNCVAVNNQLGSTHADTLRAALEYLGPRFKGPIVIADSSKDVTWDAYENFGYQRVADEHRRQSVKLVDLNDEPDFVPEQIINRDLHLTSVRLAKRLFDPDAFILGLAILKAHDNVVATLSVKNLVMAAPLHQSRKETQKWHHKSAYHAGFRQIQMNIANTARRMRPFWGATVIDGFEGMQGEGPLRGEPVASRVAVASTDFIAADRIGVELMGVNPDWMGYLHYCSDAGLGCWDRSRIQLRGETDLTPLVKAYKLHPRLNRQLEWMGALPKA